MTNPIYLKIIDDDIMGKRKRAPSPKENLNELPSTSSSSSSYRLKVFESKKIDSLPSVHENDVSVRIDVLDKNSVTSSESEVAIEDRPTLPLRISARVQNKQRREENKLDAQTSSGISLRKIDSSSQDEDEEEEKKVGNLDGDQGGMSLNGELKKRRRAWELWSLEDKKVFFEALNECGKDFEAIQNFLVTKLRKKGFPTCVIKNKDQVRHFYYRTWHKISKHIKFGDDIKKSTQELYTLINYGELRRKVGGTMDEKKGQKLQELIQKGSTSVRIKGKKMRIKTPICRALKKLNEIPDEKEQSGVRMPTSVVIEIVPANVKSWNYVQSVAHNPRVRISCSMHKTVGSIIEHLQTKWRCTKWKICDNLTSSANFPIDFKPPPPLRVRLRPMPYTNFNNVQLKPDTQIKSFVVSLSSHSQMLQRKGEIDCHSKSRNSSKNSKKRKCSVNEHSKEKGAEDLDIKDAKYTDSGVKDDEKGEISQEENEEGSDIELDEELKTPPPPPPSVVHTNSSEENTNNKEEEVFGKSQVISLEYDFENNENSEEESKSEKDYDKGEDGSLVEINIEEVSSKFNEGLQSCSSEFYSTPIEVASQRAPSEFLLSDQNKDVMNKVNVGEERSEGENVTSSNKTLLEDGKDLRNDSKSAEDLSSMLAKLIYIIKMISSKNPTECVCGNSSTPIKCSSLSNFRSPSNSRSNGLLRSPGNLKSPRGCSLSVRSPRTPNTSTLNSYNINFRDTPSPAASKNERPKPSSAKRLINEYSSDKNTPAVSSAVSILDSKDNHVEAKNENFSSSKMASQDFSHPQTISVSSSSSSPSSSSATSSSSSGGGEFLVPTAPAPRNLASQTNESFNAQLSKLLPRYSRPNRRPVRKSMVVQRQLPLMPNQPRNVQGFVALKSSNLLDFNISTAPQISLPIAVTIAATPTSTPRLPLATTEIISTGPAAGSIESHVSSIVVQSQQQLQPAPQSMPVIANTFSKNSINDCSKDFGNAISVNVSGHQLLTVKMPSYPVSSQATIAPTTTTLAFSSSIATATTTCALPIVSDSFHNTKQQSYSVSNETKSNVINNNNNVNANNHEPSYLTTPPSTPLQLDVLLNNSNSIFNKEDLNCFNDNSNSSFISISDIEVRPLSTPIKANVSPPSKFAESSVLETPTHGTEDQRSKNELANISPIKLNLSFLSDSPVANNNAEGENGCCTTENGDIPQIHIPESEDNLPLLDISLGGTISVKEASTNLVGNMPMTSIVDNITSVSSVESLSQIPHNDSTPVSEILPGVPQIQGISNIVNVSSVVNMTSMSNVVSISEPSTNVDSLLSHPSSSEIDQRPSHVGDIIEGQLAPALTLVGKVITKKHPLSEKLATDDVIESTTGFSCSNLPLLLKEKMVQSLSDADVKSTKLAECHLEKASVGGGNSVLCLSSLSHSVESSSPVKLIDLDLANSNSNSCFSGLLASTMNQPCLDSVMETSLLETPPRPMLSGRSSTTSMQTDNRVKTSLTFDSNDGFEPLSSVPLSPPSSPSRLLRQNESHQWISSDTNEFSLSSLLNSIDSNSSPSKGPQQQISHAPGAPSPSMTQNPHTRGLFATLNDNSVDFTATFANLKGNG
ncbi:Protein cramped-like [Armadillidium nasatum]|uniref:Protein cramped-like n=1 Tax=Armadillidium nasatum TaxID=96803 RepID=A0A5N5TKM4_9CRUS|nr:Protein cramped-like [Armadillidium nasatum]